MENDVTLHCGKIRGQSSYARGSLGDRLASLDKEFLLRVSAHQWSRLRARSGLYSLQIFFKVLRLKPDLVICRDFGSMFLLNFTRLNVVFEVHDFPKNWDFFKRVLCNIVISTQEFKWRREQQSLVFVFISRALSDKYKESFFLRSQTHLTIACTSTPYFPLKKDSSRRNYGATGDRLTAIYAGALRPEKGINLLVHIASELSEVDFVLVGNSSDLSDFTRQKLAGMQNVTLIEYTEHDQVHQIISRADIALLPNSCPPTGVGKKVTHINMWTSPLKVFDYLAAGVVVFYSNIPVLNEILRDGATGISCECNNPSDWIRKIRFLSTNSQDMQRLAQSGRTLFESKYTLKKRCETLLGIKEIANI